MRDPRVWAVLAWALAVAWSDLRRRRISNLLTVGAAAFALAALAVERHAWLGASVLSAFAGAGIALAFTVPAFVCRMLGGGDVKFLAATGLVGGMTVVLQTFVAGALLAGAAAVAWLVAARHPHLLGHRLGAVAVRCAVSAPRGRCLPFGAALALALAGVALGGSL